MSELSYEQVKSVLPLELLHSKYWVHLVSGSIDTQENWIHELRYMNLDKEELKADLESKEGLIAYDPIDAIDESLSYPSDYSDELKMACFEYFFREQSDNFDSATWAAEMLEDRYCGEFENEIDYCNQMIEEWVDYYKIPEFIAYHIDVDSIRSEFFEYSGYHSIWLNCKCHVFRGE